MTSISQSKPYFGPQWLKEPGPWRTLCDKGMRPYLEEMKIERKKNKKIADIKRKEKINDLFQIELDQGRPHWMWPYDYAKMTGADEETLQECRYTDHNFYYHRQYPDHEYNPDNYIEQYNKYPDYDEFHDFEYDNGTDYENELEDYILFQEFQHIQTNEISMDVLRHRVQLQTQIWDRVISNI